MNKLLLTLVLPFFFVKATQGQIHISTSLRSDFTWNSSAEEWSWVSDDENEQTFFEKELRLYSLVNFFQV
jgi:hypothetical protein